MAIIWLELHTDCPRCLAAVPMNLVANAMPCPRCGTQVALAPDVALAQVVSGREGQVGMFGNAGGIGGRFGPVTEVPCARCEAAVDPFHATPEGVVRCERCQAPISVRAVPQELAAKVPGGITHFVGESRTPRLADDGKTPLVQRFYLWSDPQAEARAEAAKHMARRRAGVVWLTVGVLLCGAGVFFELWRGADAWRALTLPVVSGGAWAAFGLPLGALTLGAIFTGMGADRLNEGLTLILGVVGFLACVGCGLWLYFKGHAPWAVTGTTTGGAFFIYYIRDLIPST